MDSCLASFDGTSLCYRYNTFKGRKTPFVFIHGLSGNRTAFKGVIKLLNKRKIPNLAFDLRGHGKSSKRADITVSNCAHDLHGILEEEKISKCILVAHCFGGPIALEFYRLFPENVKKIVLMNTTHGNPFTGKDIHPKITSILLGILKKSLKYHKPVRKRFLYNNCMLYKNKGMLHIFLKDLLANPTETYIQSLIAYLGNDQEDVLSKITVPVLILGGKKDMYISYKASEILHRKIRNSKLVMLENADHIPVIRNPELISRLLLDFCT